jgi:hypothetical protein
MRRRGFALTLLLAAGCSGYYNGMYSAEQFAGRARRAEQEGRTFDATSLWGQVSVRAESVLVRHPRSRWSDKARLLQGTALAKLKDCGNALPPLEAVMIGAREAELAEQAALLVGSCRVAVGDPIGATSAYARLTKSRNAERRNLALLAHGRALRLAGSYEEALAELAGSGEPSARGERAATLAALGRVTEAELLADSLIAASDSTAPFDSVHAGFVRHDTAAASRLVERISGAATLPAALRTALLLQDARRLMETDSAAADRRFAEAQAVGRGTALAAEARLQASSARIARAVEASALQNEANDLEDFGEAPGTTGNRAQQLATVARRVILVADSAPPGSPGGDLRLFVAGELARDSLGAPRFAARQFQRIVTEWPRSEYAPKALLALIALEPAGGDSLREIVRTRYGASPYVLFASGQDAPAYEVLEDSLRRFTENFRPEGRRPAPRPARPGTRPGQPTQPRTPNEPQ